MSAAVAGLAGGLATMAISEVLFRRWGSRPVKNLWKMLVVGVTLRTLWVLGVLLAVLAGGVAEPGPFSAGLFAGYLVAQVWEGLRYQRLVRSR